MGKIRCSMSLPRKPQLHCSSWPDQPEIPLVFREIYNFVRAEVEMSSISLHEIPISSEALRAFAETWVDVESVWGVESLLKTYLNEMRRLGQSSRTAEVLLSRDARVLWRFVRACRVFSGPLSQFGERMRLEGEISNGSCHVYSLCQRVAHHVEVRVDHSIIPMIFDVLPDRPIAPEVASFSLMEA